MSSSKSSFKFTPFHPRYKNDFYNQNLFSSNTNFNNIFTNNNYSQNYNHYQDSYSGPNIHSFNNNLNDFNETNNLYYTCYILITGFDEYSEQLLYNFIKTQGINFKKLENDKILIKFQNQRYRDEFMNEYNKVKDNFFGVEIKFIDENEKERIINNNINRVIHNISYNNNYMDNNTNMIKLPKNKTNLQKFLDVFFNF